VSSDEQKIPGGWDVVDYPELIRWGMDVRSIVNRVTGLTHVRLPAHIYTQVAQLAGVSEVNQESFVWTAEEAISQYLIMKFIDADTRIAASRELGAIANDARALIDRLTPFVGVGAVPFGCKDPPGKLAARFFEVTHFERAEVASGMAGERPLVPPWPLSDRALDVLHEVEASATHASSIARSDHLMKAQKQTTHGLLRTLVFELERAAIAAGGGFTFDKNPPGSGSLIQALDVLSGSLIQALDTLRELGGDEFIPRRHPLSTYQRALDAARARAKK
jgi:hypothetical protein